VPNPTFAAWKAQEQQVLSYLLTSVSHDVLIQVVVLPSAYEVWKHIKTSFASQLHARVINTRMTLATTQKGLSTIAEYISKMKTLANNMASVGKKLDDEELCSYILAGLDYEYNSLVSSVAARVDQLPRRIVLSVFVL
jgi:glutathionylspermidine synthase